MKRCAIYTRKSTDEGLEQDFNSLHAQREACEAFIKSQQHEGWKLIKTAFDDGGVSGGTMDRPALQRLMEAVKLRQIDVIVVYKVDRLTRSLADFAKIVELLDAHDVSFVSVTQQFNTTSSMGRLTLNVLLSFAQFEREVTAERIRDKIAASKKKGMWMGGPVPLGYDVKDRKLVINEMEAKTVRFIFDRYLELGSVRLLKRDCGDQGIVTKVRRYQSGQVTGGKPISRGNLYQMLSNPIYAGMIPHQGEAYPGLHDAIIDGPTWKAVQDQLADNAVTRRYSKNAQSPSLLTGLVFDDTGDLVTPTHASRKGRRYRYYISSRIVGNAEAHPDGWRLRAETIEQAILDALRDRLQHLERESLESNSFSQESASVDILRCGSPKEQIPLVQDLVERIDLCQDKITIRLTSDAEQNTDQDRKIDIPIALKRRGVERKIVVQGLAGTSAKPDLKLCALIAKPILWLEQLTSGDTPSLSGIAEQENLSVGDVSRTLQLAFLAPDIIEAIVAGRQPIELTANKLKRLPALPTAWPAQRQQLGFSRIT
ncbi:MAG: recombinase family protein [Alphaproteobacteria bacterium]